MAKKKAMISLPEELMLRVDIYGSRLQMSRSQVTEEALKVFLDGKVPEFGTSRKQNDSRD